jgi:flagellin-like hook-associated protein FlgL
MPITLGANIASLRGQRQLGSTSDELSSVFQRLSSGQRINKASDDAAGLAIADSLKSDGRVFRQGVRNLNDGLSVLSIADGATSELADIVIRIKELAEQSANGTFSNTQRASLDEEAQALRDEFFRVSRSAEFNGLNLFDGSLANGLRLQGGYGEAGGIHSSLGGVMGDGSFSSAVTYGAGDGANSISSGDFNADGVLDLVTANAYSLNVTVSLGTGDGSFSSAVTYGAGVAPFSVRSGDFNGDGALDLVTANAFSNDVTVLLGTSDGSFSSAVTYGAGDKPFSASSGDFNGDGVLDLVTANRDSNDISVLLGTGDGSFSAAVTYGAGDRPQSLNTGDFNADGVLDLVTANQISDYVTVLLGTGDGSFSAAVSYGAGDAPQTVSSGDFNRDGVLDLVTANAFSNDVTVLLGTSDGSFSSAVTYGAGVAPRSVSSGDFNGDGVLDLVTANTDSDDVTVLLGTGDGSFSAAVTYGVGDDVRSVSSGDFNADGVLDLVTANFGSDDITVLLGQTREGIAPIVEFSLKTQADALQALAPLSNKLKDLSNQRGIIGAFQSRLSTAVNVLESSTENIKSAESQIRDADIADESSKLTRLSILQQAGSAVLAQANLQPALALQLLQ